jgi:very-short-patch-repair endonuclease
MTRQERHLWYDFLRSYPVKIYRQRTISGFITDFYCASAKLVIELDGSQHYTPEGLAYDQGRTEIFNRLGIDVIRFTNRQIDTEFDAVCTQIDRTITSRRE